MVRFFRHFQIFIFLLRMALLGIFLFTSTLSFAINCWDHYGVNLNQNNTHTHGNSLKNDSHHNTNEHDEGCHTSERIQKDTSVHQFKKQAKTSPILHAAFLDIYNADKTNSNFRIEEKIFLPIDPPGYNPTDLVWIVILNC